jgi:hypothetical protein
MIIEARCAGSIHETGMMPSDLPLVTLLLLRLLHADDLILYLRAIENTLGQNLLLQPFRQGTGGSTEELDLDRQFRSSLPP